MLKQFRSRFQHISPNPAKHTVTPKIDNETRSIVKGQPYCKLELIVFRPNSWDWIARVLRQWDHIACVLTRCKPANFSHGEPQVDENAVEARLADLRVVRGLWELLMVEKRLSQFVGGDRSLVRAYGKDNRIDGLLKPLGITTSRAPHLQPNLAYGRGADKPDGHRFRDCLEPYPGCVFVGADMEGLDGRGFGYRMTSLDGGP
jgi:hypothetical protein